MVQQSLDKLEVSYITWMEKHNKYRDAGNMVKKKVVIMKNNSYI